MQRPSLGIARYLIIIAYYYYYIIIIAYYIIIIANWYRLGIARSQMKEGW